MDSESIRPIMDAMFCQQRIQILHIGVHQNLFSDAYLYAWSQSIYPALHDSNKKTLRMPHEHYRPQFTISKLVVERVFKHLQNCISSNNIPTFYELEKHPIHIPNLLDQRMGLIYICKYLYMSDCFEPTLWERLLEKEKHPSEAKLISRPFDRKEHVEIL